MFPASVVSEGSLKQNLYVTNAGFLTALAWKQAHVAVVVAYPISPNTITVEKFSEYVNSGQTDAWYINSESEHSAMSSCIGAAAAGVGVATCSSSSGILYMMENLPLVAGMRLPIVFGVQCRTLSGPLNIHCDHSDFFMLRDLSWVMLSGETAQDAYDLHLIAFRIGEHPDVRLPVAVGTDGFIITHAIENTVIMSDEDAHQFTRAYDRTAHDDLLNIDKPLTMGGNADIVNTYEISYGKRIAIQNSYAILREVFDEFAELTGRQHDFIDCYRAEDAEYLFVGLGSLMGTALYAVDELRLRGLRVGLIRFTVYRPFPGLEFLDKLGPDLRAIGIFERMLVSGSYGPLYQDIASTFADHAADLSSKIRLIDYVLGVGGRNPTPDLFDELMTQMSEQYQNLHEVQYWGLRRGNPEASEASPDNLN